MIKDVHKAKLDKTLHDDLFNSTILSLMLDATSKRWTTMKKAENQLVTRQRVMEMDQGISLHDGI